MVTKQRLKYTEAQKELLNAIESVLSMADPGIGGYDVPMIAIKKLQDSYNNYKKSQGAESFIAKETPTA